MLRGGNVIALKTIAPDAPRRRFWRDDTPERMAAQGFGALRLVVHVSDLMPEPGRVDEAHLQAIADTVAAYRDAGLYTLIDFHQDEFGPSVGVRGMPDWMTFADGHSRDRGVRFPNGYFQQRAVQAAFDNFWANQRVPGTDRGVQDFYVDALGAVAARFADEPAVLGVDVMNEPATGTPCSQPDPVAADCPQLESQLLGPFYARAGAALRKAAPSTLIFVEPFMLQGALGIPIHTPTPGAPRLNGLSYHNYGPLAEYRARTNDSALAHAIETDSALLNTEWGFTNDAAELARQAQDFDDRLISWLAWARGPFEAVVNPALRGAGSDDLDLVLRAYARPYPSRTSGTPTRLAFDPDTGAMELAYATVGPQGRRFEAGARTEIRIPASNYPAGYRAHVENGRVVSTAGAPLLVIAADAGAETIHVRVERLGELPALRAPADVLSSRSLLSELMRDPGAAEILRRLAPSIFRSRQLGLATQSSLRAMQAYDHALTDALMEQIDRELAALGTAGAEEKRTR
jgi:endoglycosylceramidase